MITLVIIGVIAAITVPTLITKYQKEQTVTRLKKAYSVINQSLQKTLINDSNPNSWTISEISNDGMEELQKKYLSSLQIAKSVKGSLNDYSTTNLNGQNSTSTIATHSNSMHYFLNDGTLINFVLGGSPDNWSLTIMIDVNGLQKPNRTGRDIFFYSLGKGDFVITPYGYQRDSRSMRSREVLLDDSAEGNCNKLKAGYRCSSIIMIDGWRIADDYPW